MKRLAIVVIVAGLAWSGWWVYAAWSQRSAVEAWFADRRADGWEAGYDDLSVRGFPNRLDITFTGLTLADPDTRIVWEAPFFQILQLSYGRGHEILVWPDSQTLTTPNGRHEITSEGLRASLIHDGDLVQRATLEASVLNIGGESPLAMAGLTAAIGILSDRRYHLGLRADALATNRGDLIVDGGTTTDSAALDAEVALDAPLRLSDPLPQPRRIDVKLAEYRAGKLEVNLAGAVDIDAEGRPDGRITVRAVNWRELIGLARESGQLQDSMADVLEDGLTLVAGLSGNRNTLDLPLDFSGGKTWLGPIPLGEAPRLRLP
ncbi:DUF2125 domain-containing protein [Salipiger sp.]|uniref:DUF2125 domain-containing protein n=1 Tax=Salipiger sp. TaxID=2078585 RepID=UPI003A97C779